MATKIFIDQAHNPPGTFDSGIVINSISESNIVYNIGTYLLNFFRTQLFEVRLSRPTPTTVIGTNTASSITERVRMANDWNAHLFISLHCNVSADPSKRGTEMYVRRLYDVSYTIADIIMTNVTRRTDITNAGIHTAGFYSLVHTTLPAIVISVGYLSNPTEATMLNTRDFQYRYAGGIYRGIVEYYVLP